MMDENVDLAPIILEFQDFFNQNYKEPIYGLVSHYPDIKSLNIDYQLLETYNPDLADQLRDEPELIIYAAENALREMNLAISPEIIFKPHVRFFNLPNNHLMIENISSKHICKLICFKGVITKRAEVKHRVHIAEYKCAYCGNTTKVLMDVNITPDGTCPSCKRKGGFTIVEDKSQFVDLQKIEMQELLERLKGSTTPAKIELRLEEDLVNSITPGDTIEVTGILRVRPPVLAKGKRRDQFVYTRYLDVVHAQTQQMDFEDIDINDEDEAEIIETSKDERVYTRFIKSLVPSIYGHTEIKESVLLQMFGGTKDKYSEGGARMRDDIHILLIGDPGVAKTRILQYMSRLAPKSVFVSGKTVSGVGLTASAERDDMGDGGWTLKAGALVLASGGMVAVDEFDKIDPEDRAAMHEVMESGQVSIAKAGIVATLKAKSAILAAANPKHGRFDPNRPPAEQFNIVPTLLSRFDLIFPLADVVDEKRDSNLATKILESHRNAMLEDQVELKDPDLFEPVFIKKYIAYARQNVRSIISEEAQDKIKAYYLKMRNMGKKTGAVAITPRQIEGLVRLTEASAKIRLSSIATGDDAARAIRLVDWMMRKIAVDKETGAFDIDILTTGKPKSQVDKINTILDTIKILQKTHGAVDIHMVIDDVHEKHNIDKRTSQRLIDELIYRGELYKSGPGKVKIVEQY